MKGDALDQLAQRLRASDDNTLVVRLDEHTLAKHTIVAVCDFCGSRPVVGAFNAKDFFLLLPDENADHHSVGGWATCQACHDFIARGDREGLLTHAVDTLSRDIQFCNIPREILRSFLADVQDGFWDARIPEH